jgi:hypothetical protein
MAFVNDSRTLRSTIPTTQPPQDVSDVDPPGYIMVGFRYPIRLVNFVQSCADLCIPFLLLMEWLLRISMKTNSREFFVAPTIASAALGLLVVLTSPKSRQFPLSQATERRLEVLKIDPVLKRARILGRGCPSCEAAGRRAETPVRHYA